MLHRIWWLTWRQILLIGLLVSFAGVFAACPVAPGPPPPVSAKLEAVSAEYTASTPLSIRFTLTNQSTDKLSILKWNTPLEGFYSDMFVVKTDTGEPAPYSGILALRAAPIPEDYVLVEPGQALSVEFDLDDNYDVIDPGNFSVQYVARISYFQPLPSGALGTVGPVEWRQIESNAVTFRVSETREVQALFLPLMMPGFSNCAQNEMNTLYDNLAEAERIGINGYSAMYYLHTDERSRAPRYFTWFRQYTNEQYQEVLGRLDRIHSALAQEEISFNCAPSSCGPRWIAYVDLHRPYEVNLCGLYWGFPATGRDSQAGILIHEVSHFYQTAGCKDHAYCWNQSDCTSLSPDEAIENADSFRRFMENVPAEEPDNPVDVSIFCPVDQRCCTFSLTDTCTDCRNTDQPCGDGCPEDQRCCEYKSNGECLLCMEHGSPCLTRCAGFCCGPHDVHGVQVCEKCVTGRQQCP